MRRLVFLQLSFYWQKINLSLFYTALIICIQSIIDNSLLMSQIGWNSLKYSYDFSYCSYILLLHKTHTLVRQSVSRKYTEHYTKWGRSNNVKCRCIFLIHRFILSWVRYIFPNVQYLSLHYSISYTRKNLSFKCIQNHYT